MNAGETVLHHGKPFKVMEVTAGTVGYWGNKVWSGKGDPGEIVTLQGRGETLIIGRRRGEAGWRPVKEVIFQHRCRRGSWLTFWKFVKEEVLQFN